MTIGTELTLGLILNQNSQYISEKVSELGFECNLAVTVGDDIEDIKESLKYATGRSEIVIISGGLGPTDDDLTRAAVAETLGLDLVRDGKLDESSLKFVRKKRTAGIKERLLRQSYIPRGSVPIIPVIGSASGFRIELEMREKYVFCIPGVPKEMKSMMERDVLPFLRELISNRQSRKKVYKIKKKTILTTDISETEIEEKIKEIAIQARNTGINIGITANPGLIKIILISRCKDDDKSEENLKYIEEKISKKIGSAVYGKDDSLISDNLKDAISRTGKCITISTAESITGGLISSIITDTPGSSGFFRGGIIPYSDFAKENLLKINSEIIREKGAVSAEVCLKMAKSVKRLFKSDYAISVTGYAGPDYEDDRLGQVFCCILGPDGFESVYERRFVGTRTEIKFRTTQFVLNKLRNAILEKK
ncbi:MAG: CinA family nicotinamide mononucleotide deamidase-related protein [Actinobacteria bacterium]|nr:CinA family nicotinamide mononucleotide deamidase-related protein [Actinomycetota bacterium]